MAAVPEAAPLFSIVRNVKSAGRAWGNLSDTGKGRVAITLYSTKFYGRLQPYTFIVFRGPTVEVSSNLGSARGMMVSRVCLQGSGVSWCMGFSEICSGACKGPFRGPGYHSWVGKGSSC